MKILHPTDFPSARHTPISPGNSARVGDLRQRGIKASWRAQAGVPFEEIVRIAEEERMDMIVMGTHGRTGLNRALLGSVAERVIRLAPCPVLTVRQTKSEAGR
jgi:nucleotide-binding universal stress UspA family protein